MYAISEGEDCPPTARDSVVGDGEKVQRTRRLVLVSGNAGVPMSFENEHWDEEEEEEVLREAASEVEPYDSVTVDSEEEVAAIDVPVPRPGIIKGSVRVVG